MAKGKKTHTELGIEAWNKACDFQAAYHKACNTENIVEFAKAICAARGAAIESGYHYASARCTKEERERNIGAVKELIDSVDRDIYAVLGVDIRGQNKSQPQRSGNVSYGISKQGNALIIIDTTQSGKANTRFGVQVPLTAEERSIVAKPATKMNGTKHDSIMTWEHKIV